MTRSAAYQFFTLVLAELDYLLAWRLLTTAD